MKEELEKPITIKDCYLETELKFRFVKRWWKPYDAPKIGAMVVDLLDEVPTPEHKCGTWNLKSQCEWIGRCIVTRRRITKKHYTNAYCSKCQISPFKLCTRDEIINKLKLYKTERWMTKQ